MSYKIHCTRPSTPRRTFTTAGFAFVLVAVVDFTGFAEVEGARGFFAVVVVFFLVAVGTAFWTTNDESVNKSKACKREKLTSLAVFLVAADLVVAAFFFAAGVLSVAF